MRFMELSYGFHMGVHSKRGPLVVSVLPLRTATLPLRPYTHRASGIQTFQKLPGFERSESLVGKLNLEACLRNPGFSIRVLRGAGTY